uniref:Ig-like domain-containing protein n=1 Tax=Athene cunicularia TaxID=194338 RepID=A0A663LLN1_ATHCN
WRWGAASRFIILSPSAFIFFLFSWYRSKEGETVILNCHFNSPRPPSLPDLTVKWYKEDEKGQMDLLENNVTILPNNSRIFMSGDLSHGDASLVILNVTTSDHGIYFCEVTLPDGKVVTGDGTKLRIRRALVPFTLISFALLSLSSSITNFYKTT